MKALVFENPGSADVLHMHEAADPVPSSGELLVAVTAAGLNFADIYRRQGRYPLAGTSPYIAGYEGAGRVIAVGENVTGWKTGDRVGFADVPLAHASHIRVPADHAIRLPEWLSETDAAAVLLQGLTADYLLHDVLPLRAGMHVAVLAAAGGVGRLLLQMLKHQDIHAFAVASSLEKQKSCLELGADAAANYDTWPEQVRVWQSAGCDVVFDSVGTTLTQSLDSLKDGGRVVLFGMSGGALAEFDPTRLQLNSHGILGADLWTYLTSVKERQCRADRLFALIKEGSVVLPPVTQFALSSGADAHRLLETRSFSGKIVLVP
ncbi:NADPH:quinone reductase-like Zn-dependent oxidoreductase [Rahnella sp. BIGb0603]|uniref:zinc-binding dehydrogenase n=1 Tax=Rahnella sp. BIGb0603 TaxID=2940612 RepID=UPI002169BACA|nr:zinc-binding dehydrogenase [Rahnella sp. BIGb0603]MCS3422223.1 NADPH:quinone reductase-like Zn-dependent oxidoreductase [Rahnella sp. BIGb0603]